MKEIVISQPSNTIDVSKASVPTGVLVLDKNKNLVGLVGRRVLGSDYFVIKYSDGGTSLATTSLVDLMKEYINYTFIQYDKASIS